MARKKSRGAKKKAGSEAGDKDRALRQHLLKQLSAENAHVPFDDIVAEWPAALRGAKPAGTAHTPWQLLEHLRIAQWDILDFCRNPNYRELEFPAGYWPATEAPPGESAWQESIKAFRADLEEMKKLVADPKTDLFTRIPHGEGQTYLREALLVASHNSYHLGQLVLLRRLQGAWPAGR